uniref:Retrotransposon gag domain-containing protein n=1 Tax=Nelumbo nucifera TaxID=4432 RepID=A0A822YDC0_NELNU|nr:TPA_asm: hypothetical protein HUJ06_030443 [Nelumbo nucifera]
MNESNAWIENTIAGLRDMIVALANQQSSGRREEIGENSDRAIQRSEQGEQLPGNFFSLDNTSPEAKVKLASIHMEGKALQWHHALMKARVTIEPMNWEEYAKVVSDRFGPIYEDPMSELMSLRQTGTVEEYIDRFEGILTRVELTIEYQLSCFLTGLEMETQMQVCMFNPKSVQAASQIAKLYETSQNYKHTKPPQTKHNYPFPKPLSYKSIYNQNQFTPT